MDSLVKWKYLKKHHFRGFDNYKYRAIDTNPLSVYVMHPLWNALVECVPMWVAPNLLTFVGWLLTLSNITLISYYDWGVSVSANADISIHISVIPRWVWLYCAASQFWSYMLDGMDGKQARRTMMSSPLGELFDHGLDSSASWMMPVTCISVVGIGVNGISEWQFFALVIAIMSIFYLSHWEKYNTSVLFLPWLYDISQVFLVFVFLATYFVHPVTWKMPIFANISIFNAALSLIYISVIVGAFPSSCYNIYRGRRDHPEWCRTHIEGLAPLLAIGVVLFLFIGWALFSPSNILKQEPRIFISTVGNVYAYITCRLIVAQMSATRCDRINWLTYVLLIAIACGVSGIVSESMALYAFFCVAVLANVHYCVCVVNALCDHLNVRCFKVTPLSHKAMQNGNGKSH